MNNTPTFKRRRLTLMNIATASARARIVRIGTRGSACSQPKAHAARVIAQHVALDHCVAAAAPEVDAMFGKPAWAPELLDQVVADHVVVPGVLMPDARHLRRFRLVVHEQVVGHQRIARIVHDQRRGLLRARLRHVGVGVAGPRRLLDSPTHSPQKPYLSHLLDKPLFS